MKYPTKLSDAVHILCFIALAEDGQPLTSDAIAKSIATNASYVRQLMSLLRRGELLTSVRGHARPALTRPPVAINLFDCYRAVEGEKPLLHQDTHTNPDCGMGVNIQLALRDCYDQVQQRAEEEMARITLQEVLDRYREKNFQMEQNHF